MYSTSLLITNSTPPTNYKFYATNSNYSTSSMRTKFSIMHCVRKKNIHVCFLRKSNQFDIWMKISDKIANEMLILTAWKHFVFFLDILCQQQCKPDVSKSVVTAIRFTVRDQIIIKCSWINKKYEATFWRCFLTEDSFNGLKHLTEKVTAVATLTSVRVVVDHTMPTLLQRLT